MNKRNLWIFDIDGTLANNLHRIKHLTQNTTKDWDAFFAAQDKDEPYEAVMHLMNTLHKTGDKVIVITARDERFRAVTLRWLQQHCDYDFPDGDLFMRKSGDRTDDDKIKLDILNEYLSLFHPRYKVMGVFEDRHRVIDAWREAGYYVFECNQDRADF
jgi:predicted secreted acid phosphatase